MYPARKRAGYPHEGRLRGLPESTRLRARRGHCAKLCVAPRCVELLAQLRRAIAGGAHGLGLNLAPVGAEAAGCLAAPARQRLRLMND